MGEDRGSNGLTGDEAAKSKAAAYVGQVVSGRYRVDSVVALGGMGAVFRAEHVHLRKRVALKLLHPMTENLPELVTRFERESIVGAHVSHPNVCQATDFGQLEDGSHYLVLEYVEGKTLHEVLRQGRMDPARAAEIALQIAAGLGAAHQLGIVHRDVKPANVMLLDGPEVQVKIVDFGLAKLPPGRFRIDEKLKVTTSGMVFGTVAYMAPELARGMGAVDHRSDLYALGVMLYEMLGGKHPFTAVEPSALFKQHCTQPPPPIAVRAPGGAVPPALEAVVMKLLAKDPRARYQSADELIEALDEASPPDAGEVEVSASARAAPAAEPDAADRALGPAPSDASPPPAPSAPITSAATVSRPAPRSRLPLLVAAVLVVGAVGAAWSFSPQLRAGLGAAPVASASPGTAEPRAASAATAAPASTASASPALAASTVPASSAAPAGSGSASAAADRGAAAAVVALASPEVIRLRSAMNDAAATRDARRCAASLLAFAKAAPDAFRDRDVIAEAAAVTVAAALDPSVADEVFALLGGAALGQGGADVLFHVVSFYGGSRGATRSAALLATPEVLARASPSLRVTRELKGLPCKGRAALFDRAADDGDERTLTLLSAMLASGCDESSGACCTPGDPRLAAAVGKLRLRLRK